MSGLCWTLNRFVRRLLRIILESEVVGSAIGEQAARGLQAEDSILRWSTMRYPGECDAGRAEALS
jgi:hypothetical protein